MKKFSILLSAAVAISALASCNKEMVGPAGNQANEGHVPFVLKADIPQTKLAIADDWSTSWEEGDVIYAVTTDEEWGAKYVDKDHTYLETIAEFVCKDGDFTTEKTISDGEHTFNFLYAPASQKSYHRGASTTYKIPATQSEDCSAPSAGIKEFYPLAGQATITTPAADINAHMTQLASIVKVSLVNQTGKDIDVTKFTLAMAGAKITGVYTVDFENLAIAQKEGNAYGDAITVNLSNGAVAAGAELPVYVVLAPVANFSGDITFTAIDSEGTVYEKTNAVSALPFEAGTYNTASFSLKGGVTPEPVIKDGNYVILAKRASGNYWMMTSDLGTAKTERFQAVDSGLAEVPATMEVKAANIWTVTKTGGSYIISAQNGKQIAWTSDNSATLADEGKLLSVENSSAKGALNVSFVNGTEKRILSLNGTTGNNYFAFYTGGQKSDLFFVPATTKPAVLYDITVAATRNGTVKASKNQAEEGETITLDVVPAEGYRLATLTYNNVDIKSAKSFTMPAANVTVAATFEETQSGGDSYTLTSADIKAAHTTAWAYTSGMKTITATDGSQWGANNTYANKDMVTIQMNKGKGSYVLTPVVPAGKSIKYLQVTCSTDNAGKTTSGVTRTFDITDAAGTAIATNIKGDDLTAGIDISTNCTQLKIAPNETNGGACYIVNIIVQYK